MFVQGRAPGIPLLGDMMSRITGVPVGAGQNLFALFPLEQAMNAPRFPVHNQLLELEQAYLDSGYILMDMRPQNVFLRPGSGRIQVIDSGALAGVDDPAPRGRPPLDVNDACLELLKFYTTTESPPQDASGYRDARGIRPIVNVQQELSEMRRSLSASGDDVAGLGGAMLDKIGDRAYTDYRQFGADLNPWLDAISERNHAASRLRDRPPGMARGAGVAPGRLLDPLQIRCRHRACGLLRLESSLPQRGRVRVGEKRNSQNNLSLDFLRRY